MTLRRLLLGLIAAIGASILAIGQPVQADAPCSKKCKDAFECEPASNMVCTGGLAFIPCVEETCN